MRRGMFAAASAVAVAAVLGGGLLAWTGSREQPQPAAVVDGYFAALARGDAPAALGYGTLPSGSRDFLTSAVLAEQLRIASIRDVHTSTVDASAGRAVVRYRLQLHFAAGDQQVTGDVTLLRHGHGHDWRLAATASRRTISLVQAGDDVTLAGAAVPATPVLLFPGAVPVRFETASLQVAPASDALGLGGDGTLQPVVEPTAAAGASVRAAMLKLLDTCVRGTSPSAALCPLPSERYVPGSLRGTLGASAAAQLDVQVGSGLAGVLTVTGAVPFRGTYQELGYTNLPHDGEGSLQLAVSGFAMASAPGHVWLGAP